MQTLFRVISRAQWDEACSTGLVPRCGADQRMNRIHLNRSTDVLHAANLWFSPEEHPVALEVDLSSVSSALKWELRSAQPFDVWPTLYLDNISMSLIMAVYDLPHDMVTGFSIGKRLGFSS